MNEDKSARYHRLKRRTAIVSTATGAGILVVLAVSPLTFRLRDVAVSAASLLHLPASPGSLAVVSAYVTVLALISEVIETPFAFYSGYVLEQRYGLSTETVGRWTVDRLKAGLVAFVFAVLASCVVYGLMGWSVRWWWAVSAAALSIAVVGLANLAPVLLLPLFYRFKPLEDEALRERLLALAGRAGARVMGVYEWGLGDRTRKANAALAGLGRTRRIIVSDTMLAEHSTDEIEVILAHELAHHVHHDIWKGLAWETALMFAGFYAAQLAISVAAPRLALGDINDVAGLPVLVLTMGAISLVLMPVAHALSRAHERRADRFALDLTGNATAFVSAMKRLGARNLAEDHPSRLTQWLFYSHPPLAERIAAAQAWGRRANE